MLVAAGAAAPAGGWRVGEGEVGHGASPCLVTAQAVTERESNRAAYLALWISHVMLCRVARRPVADRPVTGAKLECTVVICGCTRAVE